MLLIIFVIVVYPLLFVSQYTPISNTFTHNHHRSNRQVPGYLESEDALKEAGIEEVIVFCVNDPAVMNVSFVFIGLVSFSLPYLHYLSWFTCVLGIMRIFSHMGTNSYATQSVTYPTTHNTGLGGGSRH